MADAVKTPLLGFQGEKRGVGRAIGQNGGGVVGAVIAIRGRQIQPVAMQVRQQAAQGSGCGVAVWAERTGADAIHDLHLTRVRRRIKGAGPAMRGIADDDIDPIALWQGQGQDMGCQMWHM